MRTILFLIGSSLFFVSEANSKITILFLGDGMGITTVTAARIYEGQLNGLDGESNSLSFESFDNVAFVKTYSADAQIPDSAGTMSAIMTGQKTRSGVISVGPKYARGDCQSVIKDSRETLVEIAERAGLKTGVISTSRITDATPAATFSHSPDRKWENDGEMPQSSGAEKCTDIASQLVSFDYGDGIDLVLGGGRSNFFPDTDKDMEYPDRFGSRTDGRNLVEEWLGQGVNRRYVWNNSQFMVVNTNSQILGLFEQQEMNYEVERASGIGQEPSLQEMTEYAVNFLSKGEKGFFLVIEGARIDHANHNKEPFLALSDTIEFSSAVRKALELVDLEETLILVTADHSSSLAFSGYPTRGMSVLGSLSYPEFSFSGGTGFQKGHNEKKGAEQAQEIVNPAADSATHAGEDVPAYATGYQSHLIKGVMEQNLLFDVILSALEI